MFYNINTGTIEDFCGNGISDLTQRIARTPLEPLTTFTDDPLRVLRTIRFASRFDLCILDEVCQAIANPLVFQALFNKISRERIAKEFFLMIKGKNHRKAMQYLVNFNMLPVVFKIPEEFPDLLLGGYQLVCRIPREQSDENIIFYVAGGLIGYAFNSDFKVQKNKKEMKLYEFVCAESLKMSNYEVTAVCAVLSNIEKMSRIFDSFDLMEMAEVIRENKEKWEICAVLAGYYKYQDDKEAEVQVGRVKEFVGRSEIEKVWEDKPLVNVSSI